MATLAPADGWIPAFAGMTELGSMQEARAE
jgi:hypothetical protein